MANEIVVSQTLQYKPTVGGSVQTLLNFSLGSKSWDQAAAGIDDRIVAVTTSDTAYTFAVTTHGWLILHNLDPANAVDYGPDSGAAIIDFGTIEFDEIHMMRIKAGITFRMQATTATTNVRYVMIND